MPLWEQPDDGLAFEAFLELTDDRELVTGAAPIAKYPCGSPWSQKSAEQKIRELSERLAHEQQTVQGLVRQNADLQRIAGRAEGWPFACGCLVPLALWCLWQVVGQ